MQSLETKRKACSKEAQFDQRQTKDRSSFPGALLQSGYPDTPEHPLARRWVNLRLSPLSVLTRLPYCPGKRLGRVTI
ncbi:MAG: hypothetical protein ACFFCW_43205 [Candidatus Hodarchaeota archaeon]